MNIKNEKNLSDFIKLNITHNFITPMKICETFQVSEAYYYNSIAPYLKIIHVYEPALSNFKKYIENLDDEKTRNLLKPLEGEKTLISEKQLISFMSVFFKINGKALTEDMAKFLLHSKWYTLKNIMTVHNFDYPTQAYRFLQKDNPYFKISTINETKTSLSRYIKVD